MHAIIDFGGMGIGDPACDLVIAWTDFDKKTRQIFYDSLENIGEDTWNRGRAWALWKALILIWILRWTKKRKTKITIYR